jgi:hypothetical protein
MTQIKLLTAVLVLVATMTFPATAEDIYLGGFVQGLYGGGTEGNNPTSSEMTASETRLQLKLESFSDGAEFFGRLDFVYDDFYTPSYDWELREGYTKFRIGNNLDFKIGRQIVT